MFSSVTILDRWVDPEETLKYTPGAHQEAITVATLLTRLILNELQVVHTHFECIMPSPAKLPTGYSSGWVPGDIMLYPFYNLYCHEPNKCELLSKILLYEFKHITQKGGMCVIMISLCQLGFMGSKVQ